MDSEVGSIIPRDVLEAEVSLVLKAYTSEKNAFLTTLLSRSSSVMPAESQVKSALVEYQSRAMLELSQLALSRFERVRSLALSEINLDSLSSTNQIIIKTLTEFLITRISEALTSQIRKDSVTIKRLMIEEMLNGKLSIVSFADVVAKSQFIYTDSVGRNRPSNQFVQGELRNLFYLFPNLLVVVSQIEKDGNVILDNPGSKKHGKRMDAQALSDVQNSVLFPGSQCLVISD